MDELVKAVEAMQSGDDSAFQTIYSATYKQTLSVICKYCSDANAYDDLLQDTYIQFYNHIGQVKDPAAVQAWLNTTAGRIARDYGISRANHQTKPLSELEDEDGNPVEIEDENEAVHPELIADRKALAEIVNQVLEMLPKDQREALLMVYGQKTTIREMAAKLQVSENTIKSRLYQGRQKLMAHKADFRIFGVELPAVGIATVIAVTFEENMAAQAAVGAAAGAVFAKTTASGGASVSAVSGSAALSGTSSSSVTSVASTGAMVTGEGTAAGGTVATGGGSVSAGVGTVGGNAAASGTSAATGAAAASTTATTGGTAVSASTGAGAAASSAGTSSIASGAAAAAGTKAAAAGMSIGVKAVIGLLSAAVIAGGGAAAVKTMVIDKQAAAQSETLAEETADTDADDNAQDESDLEHIYTPKRIIEELNLTPNEILAKYGEPDYTDKTDHDEYFQYWDENIGTAFIFEPHTITLANGKKNDVTFGSNDEHYDVTLSLSSASSLGITDKTDVRDFIDSVGGKVFWYNHNMAPVYIRNENGEQLFRGEYMTVDILAQNDIVYEFRLKDISIIDPDNANDNISIWLKDRKYLNYVDDINKDITAEFYAYLDKHGHTRLNSGTETTSSATADTTSASDANPTQTAETMSAADKAAANAENIKAYYAMMNQNVMSKYMNINDIKTLQWQLADIDGDGIDEIMFAFGSVNSDSVGIGKMIDGKAVFIGSAGRAGAITYYPGTGYIHEEGYGTGGYWEALFVINGSSIEEDAFVDYSRDLSDETGDWEEKLYETRLKGAQIPVENEQDNEAVKYIEQFRQSHEDGVGFYYDDSENHNYEELKALASG